MDRTVSGRTVLGASIAAGAACCCRAAPAAADQTIRIGVLTDMAGVYAANTGPGSVLARSWRSRISRKLHPELKVELCLGRSAAEAGCRAGDRRRLVRQPGRRPDDGRAAVLGGVSPIGDMAKAKDKLAIFTGGASADITGEHCGPNHLHWVV